MYRVITHSKTADCFVSYGGRGVYLYILLSHVINKRDPLIFNPFYIYTLATIIYWHLDTTRYSIRANYS